MASTIVRMKRSLPVEDTHQVERPCKMSETFAQHLKSLLPRDDSWDGIPSPWEKRQLDLSDLEEQVRLPSLPLDPPLDPFIDDFSFAVRGYLDAAFRTWIRAYSNIFEANEQAQRLQEPIRSQIVESKLLHFPEWISAWNNSTAFFHSFFFNENQMVRQETTFWFRDLGHSDDVLDLLLSRLEPTNKSLQ